MKTTQRDINEAIARLGVEIHGQPDDGCYYFCHVASEHALDADVVYVADLELDTLTIEEWVEEAVEAVGQNAGILPRSCYA